MVLLVLACYMLNFSIIARWWMTLQEHLDWVHPIVCRLLLWLINNHQIMSDRFAY
jgi:hypothetical protein